MPGKAPIFKKKNIHQTRLSFSEIAEIACWDLVTFFTYRGEIHTYRWKSGFMPFASLLQIHLFHYYHTIVQQIWITRRKSAQEDERLSRTVGRE